MKKLTPTPKALAIFSNMTKSPLGEGSGLAVPGGSAGCAATGGRPVAAMKQVKETSSLTKKKLLLRLPEHVDKQIGDWMREHPEMPSKNSAIVRLLMEALADRPKTDS